MNFPSKNRKTVKKLLLRYSIALLSAGISQVSWAIDSRLTEYPIDRYFGKMVDLNCTPEIATKISAQDHDSVLLAAEATSFAQALLALQKYRILTLNPDYVAIQNADLKSLKTSYESILKDQTKADQAQTLSEQIEIKAKLVNTLNDQLNIELSNSKKIQTYGDSVTRYCSEPLSQLLNALSVTPLPKSDSIGLIARYPTEPESFYIRVKTTTKEKMQKQCFSDELQKPIPTDEFLTREIITRKYSKLWVKEYPYELVTVPQEPQEPPLPPRILRCSDTKIK